MPAELARSAKALGPLTANPRHPDYFRVGPAMGPFTVTEFGGFEAVRKSRFGGPKATRGNIDVAIALGRASRTAANFFVIPA